MSGNDRQIHPSLPTLCVLSWRDPWFLPAVFGAFVMPLSLWFLLPGFGLRPLWGTCKRKWYQTVGLFQCDSWLERDNDELVMTQRWWKWGTTCRLATMHQWILSLFDGTFYQIMSKKKNDSLELTTYRSASGNVSLQGFGPQHWTQKTFGHSCFKQPAWHIFKIGLFGGVWAERFHTVFPFGVEQLVSTSAQKKKLPFHSLYYKGDMAR